MWPPTNEDTVGDRKRLNAYWTMFTPMAIRITASSRGVDITGNETYSLL